MTRIAFEQWFNHRLKQNKNKDYVWGFTIFDIEVNGKHAMATETNQYLKIFPERNIFTKIGRPYYYKANKVIW